MCQLSARPKREERVAVDNNAFGGFGVLPLKEQRALPFALWEVFIFFALCKFIDFSMGVL